MNQDQSLVMPTGERFSAAPARIGLRALAVAATIGSVLGVMLLGLAAARAMGIEPRTLQRAGFVLAPGTVGLFLTFQAVQVAIVLLAQRFIHRGKLVDLGFRAPVARHLATGIVVGACVTAAFYLFSVGLSVAFFGSSASLEWAVPAGTPLWAVLAHFGFFLIVFLTANSFGEELVYRCYPIEQFRERPGLMVWAALGASFLFAGAHFIIGEFNLFWFLGLIGFALFCAILYGRWRSLWLIVGVHNGTGLVDACIAGNWKMGGLFKLNLTAPAPIVFFLGLVVVYGLAIWLARHERLGPTLPAESSTR